MTKPRVLVIDDDFGDDPPNGRTSTAMQSAFAREVDPDGTCVFSFCSGQKEGKNSLPRILDVVGGAWPPAAAEGWWSLVLLDLAFYQLRRAPDDDQWGFTVLAELRDRWPDLPIVMLTTEDADKKKAANSNLADGFLPKPIEGARSNALAFRRRLYSHGLFPDLRESRRLAGRSLPLLKVLREARQFACDPLGSGRLLYGETGTGKTELARFIHDQAALLAGRPGPFESWSASGSNEDITNAALFGQWHGAYTEAGGSEAGRIERAHRGTFFLDEVSSLSLGAQALFIESRRRDAQLRRLISRMGKFPQQVEARKRDAERSIIPQPWKQHLQADHKIAVDVVILTASNLNLHDEDVADTLGFRRDLLNDLGTPICIPGLNNRREDIPAIFLQIVGGIVATLGWSEKHVADSVLSDLQSRDWTKRNVVSLRQIAEHAVMSARDFDDILLRHLPPVGDPPNWPGSRPRMSATTAATIATVPPVKSASKPRNIAELLAVLDDFEASGDPAILDGTLPRIQEAYARMVLRLFEAALRATRDRRGETSSLSAVCKLLGVNKLRSEPQSYAAYDVVLRLLKLCDVSFENLKPEEIPLLSSEPEVVERVQQALQRRRPKGRTEKGTS